MALGTLMGMMQGDATGQFAKYEGARQLKHMKGFAQQLDQQAMGNNLAGTKALGLGLQRAGQMGAAQAAGAGGGGMNQALALRGAQQAQSQAAQQGTMQSALMSAQEQNAARQAAMGAHQQVYNMGLQNAMITQGARDKQNQMTDQLVGQVAGAMTGGLGTGMMGMMG